MNGENEILIMYRNVLQLTVQMRAAQKEYFKTKKHETLIEAKRLEAALDMRLAEMEIRPA